MPGSGGFRHVLAEGGAGGTRVAGGKWRQAWDLRRAMREEVRREGVPGGGAVSRPAAWAVG